MSRRRLLLPSILISVQTLSTSNSTRSLTTSTKVVAQARICDSPSSMPSTKPASRSRFDKQTLRRGTRIGCVRRSPNTSPVPTMERAPGTARHRHHETSYLNGDDLRRDPLEVRKATLAYIVAKASPGIRFNEHMEGDGPTVFANACKLGLEGIVSERKDSIYRSGRSPDWLKMKNLDAPAVKREAEEDVVPRNRELAHDRRGARPAHIRRRRLGRRHVRDRCLSASGAGDVGAATTPAADAGHLREILSVGVASDPVAACQRLLDAVHDLRGLCRGQPVHPPDADDRLADDRAVRLAVPRAVAGIQTRRRCRGLAERRHQPQPHPADHPCQPAARPGRSRHRRQWALLGLKIPHPGSVHGVITSLFMRSVIASGVLPRKSMRSLLLLHIGTQQDLVDGPGDLDDCLGRRRVDANPVPTHDLAADGRQNFSLVARALNFARRGAARAWRFAMERSREESQVSCT